MPNFYFVNGGSIQAAINAASAGDTIMVGTGVYNESLLIDKQLNIISLDGADTTIINGQGTSYGDSGAVKITAAGVNFGDTNHGFTVNASAFENAAIVLSAAADNVRIEGNTFVGNAAAAANYLTQDLLGGGNSNLIIENNVFSGTADQLIYLNGEVNTSAANDSHNVQLLNNQFSGTALNDGALVVLDADTSTVSGNTFSGAGGAALVLQQAGNTVSGTNSFGSFDTGTDIVTADTTFSLAGHQTAENLAGEFALSGVTFTGNALPNHISGNVNWFAPVVDDYDDNLSGAAGNDHLEGLGGDDQLTGGAGNDTLDGGGGFDTANFSGNYEDYTVTFDGTTVTVIDTRDESPEGTDTITNAGRINFADYDVLIVSPGGDFSSIQAAIDAADPGDTILIAAGTYNENVTINKDGLKLVGMGDATIIEGTFRTENNITGSMKEFFRTGSYSVNAGNGVTITADDVTLQSLKITSFLTDIELGNGVDRTLLKDLTLADAVNGIRKGTAAAVSDLTIEGGAITEVYLGINFAKSDTDGFGRLEGMTIDGTVFEHITQKGIYTETLSDGLIKNVVMTDVGQYGGGLAFGAQGAHGNGIDLNLKYENYSNITIEGFTFTDVGLSNGLGSSHANAAAISVKARDDATSYNANPASFTGAVVIQNGTINGTSTGIRAGEAGKIIAAPAVTIIDVTITNAVHSPLHGDVANVTTSVQTVNMTGASETLIASPTSTGPIVVHAGGGDDAITTGQGADTLEGGAGDDVLDGLGGNDTAFYAGTITAANVTAIDDADPNMDGAQAGWQVNAGAEGTDKLRDIEIIDNAGANILLVGNGGFTTIQAAIDAASDGDTILVTAGVYFENLDFHKAVTLLGAKSGVAGTGGGRDAATGAGETTIIGRSDITASGPVTIDGVRFVNNTSTTGGGPSDPTLLIQNGNDHVVTNSIFYSTVTGGTADDRAISMPVIGAGDVTVTNNYFTGSQTGLTTTASWGRAIWFDGGGVDLTVTGNTFEYSRTGINVDMTGASTALIKDNTFRSDGTAISVGVDNDGLTVQDNDFQNVGGEFNLRNLTGDTTFDADIAVDAVTPAVPANPGNDAVVILGGAGDDTFYGTAGVDVIDGNNHPTLGAAADTDALYGRGGDDFLFGRGGADTLDGGAGNDSLDGGAGIDTATGYSNAATIGVIGGTWKVTDGADVDTLTGVEKVVINGQNSWLVGAGGFVTIQEAIDAAAPGDTILIANGTYTLTSTLNVDKDVTLRGESETGVTIDAGGLDGYGIFLTGDGATLSTFTLLGPEAGSPSGNYGIKAQPFPTSSPTDALTGITIEHVTVKGSARSEIDFNGVDNSVLRNVTVNGNNTGGVGIALTDSTGITLENISTSGNQWGSVALYTTGSFFAPGTSGITFDGTYTHDEPIGIFSQDESALADLGIVAFPPAFTSDGDGVFIVRNDSFRLPDTDSETFTFFFASREDAEEFALTVLEHPERSVILSPAGDFLVSAGMSIQAAVDAASDGDTINVAAGHFVEQVTVDGLNITIKGAGQGQTFLDAPANTSLVANVVDLTSARPDKYALLGAINHAHVTLSGITIDGKDQGTIPQDADQLYDFVGIEGLNATFDIDHVTVTGIRQLDGVHPSGIQHNSAVIINNADGTARTFTMTNSIVENFQKNGFVLLGNNLIVDLNHNTVTGAGSIPTTAQNGIQLGGGATGSITDNILSGFDYTPATVVATAILAFGAGPGLIVSGNMITGGTGDGDAGIYFFNSDSPVANNNTLTNLAYGLVHGGTFTTALTHAGNVFSPTDGDDIAVGFYPDTAGIFAFTFSGSAEGDDLEGAAGPDTLNGLGGNDYLEGFGGNDVLTGGAGDDELVGGTGTDTATYGATLTATSFSVVGGQWVVTTGGAEGTDELTGIERVTDGASHTFRLVGAGGYATIQAAIDAASSGDVILIAPGTYNETEEYVSGDFHGLYINTPNLTLLGYSSLTGALVTNAADAKAYGPTVIAAAQNMFGANHWIDVNGDGTVIRGLHLKAGPETSNKLLEIWADDVTVEHNFLDANAVVATYTNLTNAWFDATTGYTGAVTVYINDNGITSSEVDSYKIDSNILNEGIVVANGVGSPPGIGANQLITNNHFEGTFDLDGFGRYDTIVVNGKVPGVGWLLEHSEFPAVSGNTFDNNTTPFILRGSDDDAANIPTAEQVAALLAANGDEDLTYAYVLDSLGALRLAARDDGDGDYFSFAVTNSIDTLNLALDNTADDVFGSFRGYMQAGDTVVIQSGATGTMNSNIVVEDLTIRATADSADLNLTLRTTLLDGTAIAGGVREVTLADYAAGLGANVDVTGNGLDNIITGNSGANKIIGLGGNDTLRGNGGNDDIDGGANTDTAVYSGARADYQVDDLGGGQIQVIDLRPDSPDGTDIVRNVENFQFSNGTFTALTVLNDPLTGGVAISGSAAENATLSIVNTLADADGLGAFVYQWLRDGADIGGANASTYTPVDADIGADISVRVSYMDGNGTLESITSAEIGPITNVNDLPTGGVTITGTPTEDQTLTAVSTLADADGLGTLHYQWKRGGVDVGTDQPTYTLGDADVGATISVVVSYLDGHGTAESVISGNTLGPVANVNDAPTGSVAIIGTATEDQTLTAVSTLADADGLGTLQYQWKRGAVNVGTGQSTYTLSDADVGATISVEVSYIDGHGTTQTVPGSNTAGPVANVNDAPSGGVSVTGTLVEGETLTAVSTLADADGLGALHYQWKRGGVVVGTDQSTYALTDADIGASISVVVTYTDGHGTLETATSAAVGPVIDDAEPPVAQDDNVVMGWNASLDGAVTASDVNTPAGPFTFALVGANGGATHGTVTLAPDGSYTYTPAPNFFGQDSFRFRANDGALDSVNVGTITISVQQVGQPLSPTPANDTGSANEYATVTGNVISTPPGVDTDPGGATLTITGISGLTSGAVGAALAGSFGSLTINANGSYSYVANNAETLYAGITGTDLFTYTVSNGLASATATLTITINGVNTGTSGNNRVIGGPGNETLDGGDGNDTIEGNGGDDRLLGGSGDDTMSGGDGTDTLIGGIGNDTMSGGAGNDTLSGGAGDDRVAGGDGDDSLGADDGNDIINGGAGNDTVWGGAGDDQVGGGSGDDIVVGDAGNDSVWGEDGDDLVNGGEGDDILLGGNGNDRFGGGSGNDIVQGEAGDDTVWGEEGDDLVVGGTGDDIIIGGADNDTFVFNAGDGNDVIVDFVAGGSEDRLWFNGTNLHSFADVQANASYNASTNVTTINYSGGTLTLNGVTLSALNAGDFIFT